MSDLDDEELKATREMKAINKVIASEEKTADEMFEELEYTVNEGNYICKYIYDKAGLKLNIEFNLKYKTITISMYDKDEKRHLSPELTMKELQAINKKCKELGWIE